MKCLNSKLHFSIPITVNMKTKLKPSGLWRGNSAKEIGMLICFALDNAKNWRELFIRKYPNEQLHG
jgi:hypothetical protein